MDAPQASDRPKVGLVLSGGGARGAYEVGVIRYVCERLKRPGHFDIITGSSVGAINGAYVAATADRPRATGRMLALVPEISRTAELMEHMDTANQELATGAAQVTLEIEQLNDVTQQATAASSSTHSRARSAATPMPTMPAVFSVPPRRSRSCGPPRCCGRTRTPVRT